MAKKQRKVGAPASCRPPADAPEWAVDAEWRQQQRILSYVINVCYLSLSRKFKYMLRLLFFGIFIFPLMQH